MRSKKDVVALASRLISDRRYHREGSVAGLTSTELLKCLCAPEDQVSAGHRGSIRYALREALRCNRAPLTDFQVVADHFGNLCKAYPRDRTAWTYSTLAAFVRDVDPALSPDLLALRELRLAQQHLGTLFPSFGESVFPGPDLSLDKHWWGRLFKMDELESHRGFPR